MVKPFGGRSIGGRVRAHGPQGIESAAAAALDLDDAGDRAGLRLEKQRAAGCAAIGNAGEIN
jgi:hypothetical protein